MRVYFRPLLLGGNPYMRELAAALEAGGVEVCGPKRGGLFFAHDVIAQRADVVHLHWLWGITSDRSRLVSRLRLACFVLQLALLRALGRRIVFTAHNVRPHESPFPDVDLACTRAAIRLAQHTIVHGDAAKEVLRRELALDADTAAKLVTIPHAHYADVYPDRMSQAEARDALGIGRDRFVFGSLGMIRPYKGVPALIDAFRSIEGSDLALVIAGRPIDDAYRAEIEARVAGDPRIHFAPGFVEEEAVQTWVKAADVMVYPFEEVLSSGSVILALSMARTVICPEVGCIRDIADSDDAYLYALGDSDGLARAMRRAIHDRAQVLEKGRRGLARVRAWGWSECADRTAALYRGEGAVPDASPKNASAAPRA